MKENQFYCLTSGKKVTVPAADIRVKMYKNSNMPSGKSPALVADCDKCSAKMVKWIKHDKVSAMVAKYGK